MNSNYKLWLDNVEDKELLMELKGIESDPVEIENRFYKHLEFGTGGLRGIIAAGTNCLNVYTIRRVTQGLANYLTSINGTKVAISYDSRNKSELFAITASEILASCGIKVYLVKELMPTPFLSFMTREYKCDMGIMITASHNPAKYNGYKVYGSDGCQLTDIGAERISSEIASVEYFAAKTDSFDTYLKNGIIEYTSEEIIVKYLDNVKNSSVTDIKNLKIAYTPLNGTGYKIIPRLLAERGVSDLSIVPQQSMPDGNFPTCSYPNPEKKEALGLGLELAASVDADILLATDPDADRVGIAVKDNSKYSLLSGNEVGVLLANFLLSVKKANHTLPVNPVIVKTIVTTNLIKDLAKQYNATVIDVLTGFKYIGEQIGLLEEKNEADRFLLGFEESYGYLVGTSVRDKDAVVAVQMICEMASHYKEQGKTLVQVLDELYKKFGYYQHQLFSYQFDGAAGSKKISELMNVFRHNSPATIGGYAVVGKKDYMIDNGDGLPKSNVISFDLEGKSQIIIRPSGTEPLVKLYLTTSQTLDKNKEIAENIKRYLDKKFV